MKKLILTTLLLFPLLAFAQVDFGVKGGGNFSKLTDDLDSDYRTGFHFGLFAEFKVKKIGIQPEVLYLTGGGESKQGIFNGDLKLDYIAVPVMLNLYVTDFLAFQFGPQFMYNSTAELTTEIGGVSTTSDVKDQINERQWAASGGLMFKLPLGIRLTGRYVAGTSNVTNDGNVESKSDFIKISLGKSFF